jgi:ligand-binding SRPBCC domain-containing protein
LAVSSYARFRYFRITILTRMAFGIDKISIPMKIYIPISVKGNYQSLIKKFDADLFQKLAPPFLTLKLLQFDGSQKGDIVHIQMSLAGMFPQEWISVITENNQNEKAAWFTDEGTKLPFFLSYWRHTHWIENEGENARIVEDIEFKTPFFLFDYLMYPILYLQFAARKPIYQKLFGKV